MKELRPFLKAFQKADIINDSVLVYLCADSICATIHMTFIILQVVLMNTYKIIDIHNHIFPEKIAEKAVGAIGEYYGLDMFGSGTVDELLESGSKIGVSKYVVLPTATKVEQVESANKFISEVQSQYKSFIGFGSLHPGLEDPELEVEKIISLGLHGVKLHPEFQNFSLDDAEMMPIYKAIEGRLPLLVHVGDENRDSSHPEKLAKILESFPRLTVIAAHFGGYSAWDESCEFLVGKNVYFDTSSSLFKLNGKKAVEMIRNHGVEKVLFGTDYPMWQHAEEFERFMRLELTETERRMILYGNAAKLMKVEG